MKKLYPGVRGRIFDLCNPTQARYKIGVTVTLGKKYKAPFSHLLSLDSSFPFLSLVWTPLLLTPQKPQKIASST